MNNLTLIIPAKNEKESLPQVLDELKGFNLKISIVLEREDEETIQSIKNYNCKIVFQHGKGYGDALITGINSTETELFCIFNADGSFNPNELIKMLEQIHKNEADLVFGTRYEKNCGSDDDTIITLIGNFIFTKIGRLFFNLNVTDILYTYVLGKTSKAKDLNLKSKDFKFCVELPIKAKRKGYKLVNSKAHERSRIGGKKKVNPFKDGFIILIYLIKLFFFRD
jgi:glycosyltransferase involved in cell wall biosynthesis